MSFLASDQDIGAPYRKMQSHGYAQEIIRGLDDLLLLIRTIARLHST